MEATTSSPRRGIRSLGFGPSLAVAFIAFVLGLGGLALWAGPAVEWIAAAWGGAVFLGLWLHLRRGMQRLRRATEQVATMRDLSGRLTSSALGEVDALTTAVNDLLDRMQRAEAEHQVLMARREESAYQAKAKVNRLVAYLKASLDAIGDALVLVDAQASTVLFANRTARSWLEHEGDDPLAGMEVGTFIERSGRLFDDPGSWASMWEVCEQDDEQELEVEFHVREPEQRFLSVFSAPVLRKRTTMVGRLWMIRDLTRQRQMEQTFREAQKMEAVGQLAGGIAHDFNNILTAIRGSLTVIEMDWQDGADPSEDIAAGAKACDRAANLVQQLLGFSRRSALQLERVDANKIVSEIVPLLKYTLKQDIDMLIELSEVPLLIEADPNQLHQVIMNLCVNARDAMPKGGSLRIRSKVLFLDEEDCHRSPDAYPGQFAAIEVADTGTGMTEDVRQRIFEPFYTTKEPGKGTGLGLATSYGIVNQHGGWITCESQPGRGTTFTIYFPVTGVDADAVDQAGLDPLAEPKHILVVDDEEAVRRLTCRILQRRGYETKEAEDGLEAIQYLKSVERKPDLMVLDLTMPRLSGAETYRRMIESEMRIPTIVCSGYSKEMSKVANGFDPKPDEFIHKPYQAPELLRCVRDIIGN